MTLAISSTPLFAASNMIGRQSQNEGINAVPVPQGQSVQIDGKLDDWDTSGRIWIFADKDIRNDYSTQVSTMWDKDNLYLAIDWKDPTPMFSNIDPAFNPSYGWKSDSVQLRVKVGDKPLWITTWYYTARKQPVLHFSYWQHPNKDKAGQDQLLLIAKPGQTQFGEGAAMAYREHEDGKGYVQEIKIPWQLLYRNNPQNDATPHAGKVMQMGMEFLWGDPTGEVWPIHRYADNMQPGATSREFFWTARNSWGNLKLIAENNIAQRKYISDEAKLEGTLPIRITIPKSAARFTIAINDANGKRVRNLAGDMDVQEYTVATTDTTRTIEAKWDLLDDKGMMVKPGQYQAIGLTQDGLNAEYEMCFYNPGTPPWDVQAGTGAWGADHCAPLRAATAGDWMILSWQFAEGGHGIIALGPDGLKKWGEKRGAIQLAADEQSVYAVPAGWHIKKDVIVRMNRDDGAYKPFVMNGQERPLELPVEDIVGSDVWTPAGMDAHGKHLLLLVNEKAAASENATSPQHIKHDGPALTGKGKIAWIDKQTGKLVKSVDIAACTGITEAADGTIYTIDEHNVYQLKNDKLVKLNLPNVAKPSSITTDKQGNLLITDLGPDMQLKAFNTAGKLLYTCGIKGSRPIRGEFNEQAMYNMTSVAVDQTGKVWTVENWDYPRRVSVWDPANGKLIKDYIGNTGYAGTGCTLDETNPNIAYVGPIQLALNKQDRTWKVTNILWVPDQTKHESFVISPGSHVLGEHFTANINGQTRSYYYQPSYRSFNGHVFFLKRGLSMVPVSAVTTVGRICDAIAHNGKVSGELWDEFKDCDPFDGVYWNDANKDAKVQRSECVIVPFAHAKKQDRRVRQALPLFSRWGQRCKMDMSFYVGNHKGTYKYTPLGYTDEGAPIFGPESLSGPLYDDSADYVPVDSENILLNLSYKNYASASRIAGIDMKTHETLWDYPNPYPGVHGSHKATMPKPGMVIGPLKIAGVAKVNDEIGRVFLIRGNLGQDFIMTTDGLFVGSMFRDGRIPAETLPSKESQLIGRPMGGFSNGGEPFNGWFGKQADGKIRMTTGFPRQAAMILNVTGLDSIKRLEKQTISVNDAVLAQADKDNLARAQRDAKPKHYVVTPAVNKLRIDGSDREWPQQPRMEIQRTGFPQKGSARMIYDDENLYL
ncbi:MAG: sugar-binding protein, partial [Phycisphaeraceae bacterium JB051]